MKQLKSIMCVHVLKECGGKNNPVHKLKKKLITLSYYIYKDSLLDWLFQTEQYFSFVKGQRRKNLSSVP